MSEKHNATAANDSKIPSVGTFARAASGTLWTLRRFGTYSKGYDALRINWVRTSKWIYLNCIQRLHSGNRPSVDRQAVPRRRRPSQRGSVLLETGLLLPITMLMACAVMDLARVFYAGIVVESAARAGVQFGSLGVDKAGAISAMNSAAQADAAGQGLTGVEVASRTFCGCTASMSEISCSTTTCTGTTPSGYVETTATYRYSPLLRYPGLPGEIVIRSSARFRAQ